jgi:hypothetical protein
MSLLNNPPQPVPTPIRNFVSFEDRVSVLLNRSGSTYKNPLTGTQRKDPDGVYDISTHIDKGSAFTLKFSIAEYSETIKSATVQEVDDEGNPLGGIKNIKSKFNSDLTNMNFSASLIAGEDLFSGATAKRNYIEIKTSLNRHIVQQVYVQDLPSNAVVLRGQVTSSSNRLRYLSANAIDGTEFFKVPVSFFPTWNDEIGRQHGATEVASSLNIAKPYGGFETVEVNLISGTSFGTEYFAEDDIEKLTDLTFNPTTSGATYDLVFRFRTKRGSSEQVLGFGYVKFEDCGTTSSDNDTPPVAGNPSGGPIIDGPTVPILVEDFGTGSDGSANTSFSMVLTGFKGGVQNDGGTADPIASVDSGSQTFSGLTTNGASNLTITDSDLLNADLVIAEVRDNAGSVKGNSIVYTKSVTDIGSMPSPPTLSSASFNFSTEVATVTVSDFGWPSTNATLYARSIQSGIKQTGSAQTSSDTFADVDSGETESSVLTYQATSLSTTVDFSSDFASAPQAVVIWAENTYGRSQLYFSDDGSTSASVLNKPTFSSLVLSTTSSTNDTLQFSLDSAGNATTGNLTVTINILPADGSAVKTQSSTQTTTTGTKKITLDSANRNVDAWYVVSVSNLNASSDFGTIDNVTA